MLGLHRTPEGLETDLRPKNGQTHSYLGVGCQGRMFLRCHSAEGHNLLLNTRNNYGMLAIEINKRHLFQLSKTVTELVNFTCEWPNSQLDPPLVASLCRLVVIHSRASYVIRHGRKSVASHSWNFYLMQTFARPGHTINSMRSGLGRRSVANWSQSIVSQSEVGHTCIRAVGLWLCFWGPSLCW